MRRSLLILMVAGLCVSCGTNYSEKELVGQWVEPVPGMDMVQGFELKEGGEAHSINMATLLYDRWTCEGDRLILTGESMGNGEICPFTDTLRIESLTEDSLIVNRGRMRIAYCRPVENSDFMASSGKTMSGTITFGHEVRSFRPSGDTIDYWIVDNSGYLQEMYKQSGQSEWTEEAELELQEVNTPEGEFAKAYPTTFEVLRVIRLGKSRQ